MLRSALLETLWQDLRFGARTLCPQPGICRHRHPDARARDRRQCRHLQRPQRRAAPAAAVGRARPRRDDLEQVDGVRQDLGGRGRGRGLSQAQPDAAGGRDLERRAGEPDRRPGARARGGRARERQHLLDARRRADDRPHVHGAGGPPQRSEARRPRLRTLEPALLVRRLARRAIDSHQRQRRSKSWASCRRASFCRPTFAIPNRPSSGRRCR